jgi:hypothetical protein
MHVYTRGVTRPIQKIGSGTSLLYMRAGKVYHDARMQDEPQITRSSAYEERSEETGVNRYET